MNENISMKNYDTVVYLMACALNGVSPNREYLSDMDINGVACASKRHSVTALVAHALEMAGMAPQKATEAKNMAIRRILLFDAERTAILSELEARKIRYMPLKGVYMKELYPSVGLREMSDNDILIDDATRGDVRQVMVSRGYEVKHYREGIHDEYIKAPIYNFEMHVGLFLASIDEIANKYYENIFERAVKIKDTEYGYRMSDEDFYIYMRAHEYKHYSHAGTGLRSIADAYVLDERLKKLISEEYVSSQLDALGILDYSSTMSSLAKKLCSKESLSLPIGSFYDILDDKEREMYLYICESGVYGNQKNTVENAIRAVSKNEKTTRRSKLKYIKAAIFPSMQTCKDIYPFFYKHKILMPILWIKRICKAIFVKPKKSLKKIGYIIKSGKENKS